ncbi:ACP phosphodiesterase [Asinibacterium sp. OR53]|uniref:acyl carrier protein phosphodiesterase n=1 Tax=Asinibacterium sp. OR53 TaxID=925409 RepID=UPI00047B15E5|nr:ACP phosphodiesterase [Asinibacterium sp. OR53]
MNYLAHAYLSFHQPDILIGNMISDFVKGKQQFDYTPGIQQGIRLHRAIDAFTDSHSATLKAKQYLKPAAGRYAGAFMDIVYDHFLALDPGEMQEKDWSMFAGEVYDRLFLSRPVLPESFASMLPFMSRQNWLYNYRFDWGISRSFKGLASRARYLTARSDDVFALFETHYHSLGEAYQQFFPDVKNFAKETLAALMKQ